ncbi:hypothetical protein SAMN04489806_1985 [Paramicrobacterium humi]|uniref:DUF998 domain-containing protein n=1 Tax=Paramicrobacterium humi TaxID=640635 RepID=A0A1H4MW70_9MICO|nr:DUF998 domain-containing protein [Microbacterium humi]SEB86602.1 hypothetical protein SAMN04489806_1985 [Microbacterium humi]
MSAALRRNRARPASAAGAARGGVKVETEALVAGVIAGFIGGVFAVIVFGGKSAAIWANWEWGSWSIGMVSVVAVAVLGTVSAGFGYWRSRRLPGQEWRLALPWWKFTLDAIVVAVVHTALGALATALLLYVVQLAFRRLSIDPVSASIGCAIVVGLAAYMLYLAVSRLNTVNLSQRMFLFVGVGLLTAMATSTDPVWWRYQISVLGAYGNRPSISFNAILIAAGALVTTFALYVDRDIRNLHAAGVIRYRPAASVVSGLFIAMGVALAGIGFCPVNVSIVVHNTFAIGLSALFGILMLVSPIVLRGMPLPFFLATLGGLLLLALATWLFYGIGFLPLTNYELIAFGVLFAWITMFVRFLAALLDAREAAPAGETTETTETTGGSDAAAAQLPGSALPRTAPLPEHVPPRPATLPDPHDTGLQR